MNLNCLDTGRESSEIMNLKKDKVKSESGNLNEATKISLFRETKLRQEKYESTMVK